MTSSAILFVALIAIVACCVPLLLIKGRAGTLRGAPPPIPDSDLQFRFGGDSPTFVFGYHKTDNTVSIWTPNNEIVRVCASGVSINRDDEYKTSTTKGFNRPIFVQGTTTDGDRIQVWGQGEYVSGSSVELKTGDYVVNVRIWLTNAKPLFPGDNRQFVIPAKPKMLYPGVVTTREDGTLWVFQVFCGKDQDGLGWEAHCFGSAVRTHSQAFVKGKRSQAHAAHLASLKA